MCVSGGPQVAVLSSWGKWCYLYKMHCSTISQVVATGLMVWKSYLTSEAPYCPQVWRARAFGFAEILYDMIGSKQSTVSMVGVEVRTVLCTHLNFIVLRYLKALSQLLFCLARF